MGSPKAEEPTWEEVEGQFTCQNNDEGCYKVAKEAKYSHTEQLLTWVCPDGHIGVVEGFTIV